MPNLTSIKEPIKLSQFEASLQDACIEQEYKVLEHMFYEHASSKLDVDGMMHNDRDRYSDIATYHKSAVKLRTGDKSDKWGNYINACYINSPMSSGSGTGDGKIIAS